MTLIEVIVAMAIISIVAVMCVSAFTVTLGSEMRETNTRRASEEAESRIAAGEEATASSAGALRLGNYNIKTNVDSYSETVGEGDVISTESRDGSAGSIDISGSRSYTVLRDEGSTQTPLPIFFGDFGDNPEVFEYFKTIGDAQSTPLEGVGEAKVVTITVPGKYSLEVWGGRGGGTEAPTVSPYYSGGGKGGYSYGEVNLNRGDKLYLRVGGAGRICQSDEGRLKIKGPYATYGGGGWVYTTSGTTGGGASDVRVNLNDPYARIIVAGGGGGGGFSSENSTYSNYIGLVSGGHASVGTETDKGAYASDFEIYQRYVDGKLKTYVRGEGGETHGGGSHYDKPELGDSYNPDNTDIKLEGVTWSQKAEEGSFNQGGQGVGANFQVSDSDVGKDFGGGGGGGGWYGGSGGSINGGGGGCGWVYTQEMFDLWNRGVGAYDAKQYKLTPKYMLTNTKLLSGGEYIPDPLDTRFDPDHPENPVDTMKGNGRSGFVRMIYLGESES
jgi:type II secretory pathway pseudopilin PulG